MGLYELRADSLIPIDPTSLAEEGVRERHDLQRLLRDQVGILDPDLLVISEEFGYWQDSRRRIDLLAVDRVANLVVIELKRDETGGHMDLQAIRYAAMVSAMTWSKAVEAFGQYLDSRDREDDAEEVLLQFLAWEEPDDEAFGQDVKIILASSDFSRELTTAVLWLNQRDIDVRCVRLEPYNHDGRVLLNVQQVIPLPEAEDFQIQLREKARRERQSRTDNRDLTRFDVEVGGSQFVRLPKRRAIYEVVRFICENGVSPTELAPTLSDRPLARLFRSVEGDVSEADFNATSTRLREAEGKEHNPKRWFSKESELIRADGRTFALTKMWGGGHWRSAMTRVADAFPEHEISFKPTSGSS